VWKRLRCKRVCGEVRGYTGPIPATEFATLTTHGGGPGAFAVAHSGIFSHEVPDCSSSRRGPGVQEDNQSAAGLSRSRSGVVGSSVEPNKLWVEGKERAEIPG
jgi:hypothetical protein